MLNCILHPYQLQFTLLALLVHLRALLSLLTALHMLQSLLKVAPAPSTADNDESNPSLDDDMDEVQFAGAASTSDPHNYKQAMKSNDSEQWSEATLAEYNTLLQNRTWSIECYKA
ncbi:hypothetical protein CVT25_011765 [Psilocybe cyanescens]|uniref:Uncharacterized protein n=1 Tax=Psilocybe cyanescens TaxID=93625 RepID=A0A409XCJ7_PSICY|nr:hypothetical protein CVT25_011765 [Psilocybe cyanescens]